jgi:zinc transport system substrate-binding protein
MRRFLTALLFFFCSALLFSGARRAADSGSAENINIVTTNFPPYDFVREIAGGMVNLNMLLPPGSESHSFEPTPRDIIRIQNADIFIYAGGESDEWVNEILESVNTDNMKIISLMDCVEVVEEEIVEGMEEEEEEEEGVAYDEHVWTSPANAVLIVQKITAALCEADKKNAAAYNTNAAAYIEKLKALDASFRTAVNGGTRKTIIFGDRFPFRYFADAYGLSYFAAFPGCSTETECSASTVAFLIDKVRSEKVPVIFHIELSNEKIADTISEATGAKKLLLHACHNISKRDFDGGVSYLELMNKNAVNLKEALK